MACSRSKKTYPTANIALRALLRQSYNGVGVKRYYPCGECKGYHLTSKASIRTRAYK